MAEESLIVKLKGDTASLDKSLSKTNKNLNETSKATNKADSSLIKFEKSTKTVDIGLIGLSKAAIGVGAALTTMITLTAKGEKELQVFAKTARTTTGDFEALAFATKQFGLDAKGTADAMNDVNERLAEFGVGDGAGAFDDFAMAMGLTKDEAKAVAAELKELSGEDALRELVKQMEEAGTSTADMNFVLKSLSNDLAYASTLFEDNGKELDRLKDRYNEVNKELTITQQEAEGLNEAAESFDLMVEALGNGTKVISAQLAPALNEFFNDIIEVVPTATNTIVDFINRFREASNIESLDSINRELEKLRDLAVGYEEQINAMIGGEYVSTDFNDDLEAQAKGLSIVNERIAELIQQRDKLIQQQEKVQASEGGQIGATLGTSATDSSSNDQLQALLDRFKSEEELLLEKYEKEREIAAGNNELLLQLEQEYLENRKLLRDEADEEERQRLQDQNDYYADILKQQGKIDKENSDSIDKNNDAKRKSDEAYVDAAVNLGNTLFEDNKAVKAGLVVVDTAAGISKAFAELPYPAALAASASIAATGVAQLAAIQSASKGGGSTTAAVPAESLPEEVPELEAQNTDLNNSNQTITIKFDESTELGVALNNAINQAKQDGAI